MILPIVRAPCKEELDQGRLHMIAKLDQRVKVSSWTNDSMRVSSEWKSSVAGEVKLLPDLAAFNAAMAFAVLPSKS